MKRGGRQRGLSYVEVLVATAVIALLAVPVSQSISHSLQVAGQGIDDVAVGYAMLGELETTLAEGFTALAARAGDTSSPVRSISTDGGEFIDLYITPWDLDNADGDDDPFTGADDGVLWVQVARRGSRHTLESVIAR